mmetsp:Transcript_42908/g.78689  ORF Transcript_42908/g.78689 Transcript_42908/m.78689 type:complete len:315 (+) Transcript_42908:49-993(+)
MEQPVRECLGSSSASPHIGAYGDTVRFVGAPLTIAYGERLRAGLLMAGSLANRQELPVCTNCEASKTGPICVGIACICGCITGARRLPVFIPLRAGDGMPCIPACMLPDESTTEARGPAAGGRPGRGVGAEDADCGGPAFRTIGDSTTEDMAVLALPLTRLGTCEPGCTSIPGPARFGKLAVDSCRSAPSRTSLRTLQNSLPSSGCCAAIRASSVYVCRRSSLASSADANWRCSRMSGVVLMPIFCAQHFVGTRSLSIDGDVPISAMSSPPLRLAVSLVGVSSPDLTPMPVGPCRSRKLMAFIQPPPTRTCKPP